MKTVIILLVLLTSYATSKNNSVGVGVLFQGTDKGTYLDASYNYKETFEKLYFGVETGIIKGVGGESSDSEIIDGYREYFNEINYKDYTGVKFLPKVGFYIQRDERNSGYNGVVLIGSAGYLLWFDGGEKAKSDPGLYTSFGVELIMTNITVTIQSVSIINPIITDSFIKGGISYNF